MKSVRRILKSKRLLDEVEERVWKLTLEENKETQSNE